MRAAAAAGSAPTTGRAGVRRRLREGERDGERDRWMKGGVTGLEDGAVSGWP